MVLAPPRIGIAAERFRSGRPSAVIGAVLTDGREVVVEISARRRRGCVRAGAVSAVR
ncbi:hypothetical protein [Streptomyces wuyuanensis]|uniref:hypothetical protein n=1 Tax=Streptomyces wuyuanensis TaxID=1196353 RepID=UPI00344523AD